MKTISSVCTPIVCDTHRWWEAFGSSNGLSTEDCCLLNPGIGTVYIVCVNECRRFLLALFRLDLVKQIFNDQTSKVQLFTEFITDILYVHDVSSL